MWCVGTLWEVINYNTYILKIFIKDSILILILLQLFKITLNFRYSSVLKKVGLKYLVMGQPGIGKTAFTQMLL